MLPSYFHDADYFMKSSSSCCSTTAPQHDAATSILHSCYSVLPSASFLLFPLNVTLVIKAKQLHLCVIRPQDMSPDVKLFVFVSFWECNMAFLCFLFVMASILAERCKACFNVDNNTFLLALATIFTKIQAFVLWLIGTLQTKIKIL